MAAAADQKQIRVVLLGGGHTNTQVIKHIGRSNVTDNVQLILVSDYDSSLYSGMCPGGVAAQYVEPQFSVDLVQCCEKLKWQFICKRIIEINDETNTLTASDGSSIEYDILSIDIGSTNLGLSTQPIQGVQEYAISTRPLKLLMHKVQQSEQQLLAKLKQQCLSQPPQQKQMTVHIVSVGGGCAGCELILGLSHRLKRSIDAFLTDNQLSDQVDITVQATLVTNSVQILSRDPKALQQELLDTMKRKQIHIITQHSVVKLDADNVYLVDSAQQTESHIPYDICLWATGAASHILDTHNIARTQRGWFKMNKYLQSVSHANIFGAGDCIEMADYPNTPKAGVYAVRQGPILIHNLKACIAEKCNKEKMELKEYIPQNDFLRLLNTGDGKAIGCKHGISFRGAWVWKLKDWIDVSWMNKFEIHSLLKEDDKHFKPKVEQSEQEKKETEKEKQYDIDGDNAVQHAVQLLGVNDEPDECQGFALQWKLLLKMNDDEQFCHDVVKLYKEQKAN